MDPGRHLDPVPPDLAVTTTDAHSHHHARTVRGRPPPVENRSLPRGERHQGRDQTNGYGAGAVTHRQRQPWRVSAPPRASAREATELVERSLRAG
ncbi:hypothetical protein ABZ793_17090 [Micromonospora sp. NPDC047465]|uniref:hypothetical protein n=1 Tax=Micromonospora sp. NPDC047465 TaxID=3154813 RepID=UPI0033C5B0EE